MDIFRTEVMVGLVEKFPRPELLGLKIAKPEMIPGQVAKWDVMKRGRDMAEFNVPGAEANIVSLMGRERKTQTMAYIREKKTLDALTMYWLRRPGEESKQYAERAVLDELDDLDKRVSNRIEWMVWQMMTGTMTYNGNNVQFTVDYGLASTHKPVLANSAKWNLVNDADPINDLRRWKSLIEEDSGVSPDTVYLTSKQMGNLVANSKVRDLLKATFGGTGGVVSRIKELIMLDLNLELVEYNAGYVPEGGSFTRFIDEDHIIMTAGDDFCNLQYGASLDHKAKGKPGKFSKSWEEEDPSARVILIEVYCLPVLKKVENIVYAKVQ
jgi:hypothetical protein